MILRLFGTRKWLILLKVRIAKMPHLDFFDSLYGNLHVFAGSPIVDSVADGEIWEDWKFVRFADAI